MNEQGSAPQPPEVGSEKPGSPSKSLEAESEETENLSQPPEAENEKTESPSSYSPKADTQITSEEENQESEAKDIISESEEQLETYTIDDAVDLAGYGKFQKLLTFLAGLGWLADSFEIIILSIIGDLLACEWKMTRWQNALVTSIVFAGMTIGAPAFGVFADRYGRRTSLAVSMLLLFIFGAASATSPNYTWMIVLRGFMGFALGGVAQGVTLCCEYYPANVRGRAGFYLSFYWAFGAIGVILSAWVIMAYMDNWRLFVLIAAVPALIVFLTMKWYPESVRYYLVSNQRDKAIATLKRLARLNKKELPKGKLILLEVEEERGKILDMLKPAMRRTTLLFWYIWLATAMAYYGIALITPKVVMYGSLLEASKQESGNRTLMEDYVSIMPCKKYSNRNFFDLFWTTAAELPGLLFFTLVVEHCSRRIFLGTTTLVMSFLLLFLMTEMKPKVALLVVLFVVRGLVAGVFQLLFIMTTEAFPTTLRASAMGTGSGFARFGGLIVPNVAQVIVVSRPMVAVGIIVIMTLLSGIASFMLPSETRGKHMEECIESDMPR